MTQALHALSPVDGRYADKTMPLTSFLSEAALIRYRIRVEVEYFIRLVEADLEPLRKFPVSKMPALRALYLNFKDSEAQRVKDLERSTNHDVKAVEYLIKEAFDELGLQEYKEFIHFGLTSQDINNTAVPLMLSEATEQVIIPWIKNILEALSVRCVEWKEVPMLARTHGQPASPTRLGKEIRVFKERLEKQLNQLQEYRFQGKFGGATGNFNAHVLAFPKQNWKKFAQAFLSDMGLDRQLTTTQIEHYDHLAAYFQLLSRINTILLDLSRDIWQYISMEYFVQEVVPGEVGSSAMPHKVNPIDFENAEGNLGLANALLEFLAAKLPVSRLQRDLTDSTVLRNAGVPLAHGLIAYQSLVKGLGKLVLNGPALEKDLEQNWAVLAEGIQTVLRRAGYPKPYETLRDFTRGKSFLGKKELHQFINSLELDKKDKQLLLALKPSTYLGLD